MATIIEETSIEAVRKVHSNACTVDEIEGAWDKDGNKITLDEAAIREAQKTLDNESTATQYQVDRMYKYPTLQEQLDLIYWDQVNGTTKFKEAIDAVKDAHPKS